MLPATKTAKTAHRSRSGQALLDIVIATGVFLILVHAIFSLMTVILETLGFSRVRQNARQIATQQIEKLTNLPYSELGTVGGIPNGQIPEFETVIVNDAPYSVHTTIVYVDDPFDGTLPSDLLASDYKQIRVEVSWGGQYASATNPIALSTNIAPKGIETSVGGGTLSVRVIDASGTPLVESDVHIVNTQVSPTIDTIIKSNSDGRVILPGAPDCTNCYEVTVTKEHYTTDKTYDTSEVQYPDKRHITVTEGELSEMTFIIDLASTLDISSYTGQNDIFSLAPNTTFRITGTKTIGTDIEGNPVFKYDQIYTTDGSSNLLIEDIIWDTYTVTIPLSENRTLTGTNPLLPLSFIPNEEKAVSFATQASTDNNLLFIVKNNEESPIASVSATISLAPSFSASASAGLISTNPNYSQIFFPDLTPGDYEFTIQGPGYDSKIGTINVIGDTQDTITLSPQL